MINKTLFVNTRGINHIDFRNLVGAPMSHTNLSKIHVTL